jgi:DNA-binding NtrC family response regulator
MSPLRVLFCDDSAGVQRGFEKNVGKALEGVIEYAVSSSLDGVRERIAAGEHFDVLVTDLNFTKVGGGSKDGLEIIRLGREHWPDVQPILLTAYDASLSVRDGLKLSSYGLDEGSLLQKNDADDPGVTWLRLRERIHGIAQQKAGEARQSRALKKELRHLRDLVALDTIEWVAARPIEEAVRLMKDDRSFSYAGMVGRSFAMQDVFKRIERAARLPSDVLILGPTGVGKDLVANAIHKESARGDGPFVKVDLTTIADNLIESELFGHEKGSFTGADQKKDGLFKAAAGGTFFLDEIGNVPLEVQAKLLRVLEERKFRPVGATKDLEADVRVVAATNADLERLASEGKFREDLYERLNAVRIRVPALAERREDIPLQAAWFLERFRVKFGFTKLTTVTRAALEALLDADWPRNVRQLRNAIERVFAEIDESAATLDREVILKVIDARKPGSTRPASANELLREILKGNLSLTLAEIKRQHGEETAREIIRRTMIHFGGMPDAEDCVRYFDGMNPNSWRQFAFQLGVTWKGVKESLRSSLPDDGK